MPIQYQLRRGLAADWTTNNTILAAGEPGFETDTKKMKIGDGSTAWTSLGYTTGNSSYISVGNSTVNVVANTTSLKVSNATLSVFIDNDNVNIGNSTVNTSIDNTRIATGNASVNATVNATAFALGTNFIANTTVLTFAPNTFNLGTSPTKAANGWAWLPNGMKVNWGVSVVNSAAANVVFSSAFGTACYGVYVMPAATILVGANTPYVTYQAVGSMLANVQIRSATTNTTSNCYWLAIGV